MSSEPGKSKRLGLIIGTILILGGIYAVFFIDWKREKSFLMLLFCP